MRIKTILLKQLRLLRGRVSGGRVSRIGSSSWRRSGRITKKYVQFWNDISLKVATDRIFNHVAGLFDGGCLISHEFWKK